MGELRTAILLSFASAFVPLAVVAQAPVPVAVFPSAHGDPTRDRVADALGNAVLADLGRRRELTITTRPALDLPATTLALGCAPESVECLNTVVREAGVQALIAPAVEVEGATTTIKLTYFDALSGEGARSVTRAYQGEGVEQAAFDAVPAMLNELLRSPPAPAPVTLASPSVTQPNAQSPTHHAAIVAPIALASLGVVATGVGIAFGISARHNETKYRDAETGTVAEVDRARSYLDRAQDQARAANILFGAGAAAIAAGAVWLAFGLSDAGERNQTAISTSVGPSQIGLAVNGPLGGRSW